jgi:hypothetical protein
LARISPAAIYLLATMNLSGTDTGLKSRTELSMQNFHDDFNRYIEQKQEEDGDESGF